MHTGTHGSQTGAEAAARAGAPASREQMTHPSAGMYVGYRGGCPRPRKPPHRPFLQPCPNPLTDPPHAPETGASAAAILAIASLPTMRLSTVRCVPFPNQGSTPSSPIVHQTNRSTQGSGDAILPMPCAGRAPVPLADFADGALVREIVLGSAAAAAEGGTGAAVAAAPTTTVRRCMR